MVYFETIVAKYIKWGSRMKILKQLILSVAGVVLLFAMTSKAGATEFTDVSDDFWAKGSIEFLAEKGVIGGYSDGSFKPNQAITRSQAAAMMVRALDIDTSGRPDAGFSDVSDNHPNRNVINAVSDEGIIRGSGDRFRPGEAISRAQMAAVLRRGFELDAYSEVLFTDIPRWFWSFTDISTIAYYGITTGYEDGTYRPSNNTTRAQFAVFLDRVMNLDDENIGDYHGHYPLSDIKVMSNGWTYAIDEGTPSRYVHDQSMMSYSLTTGEREVVLSGEDVRSDYLYIGGDTPANDAFGFIEGSRLTVIGDWIYYPLHSYTSTNSGRETYHIYRVRKDGTGKERLISEAAHHYHIAGDAIYYLGYEDDSELWGPVWKKANLDGTNPQPLISLDSLVFRNYYFEKYYGPGEPYSLVADGNYVYYSTESAVYRMDVEGRNQTRLIQVPANGDLAIMGRHLYVGSYRGLYQVSPDGSGHKQIMNEQINDLIASNGMLFILTEDSLYTYSDEMEEPEFVGDVGDYYTVGGVKWRHMLGASDLLHFPSMQVDSLVLLIDDGKIVERKELARGHYFSLLARHEGNYYFRIYSNNREPEIIYRADGIENEIVELGTAGISPRLIFEDGTLTGVGTAINDEATLKIFSYSEQFGIQEFTVELSLPEINVREIERNNQELKVTFSSREDPSQVRFNYYEAIIDMELEELVQLQPFEE